MKVRHKRLDTCPTDCEKCRRTKEADKKYEERRKLMKERATKREKWTPEDWHDPTPEERARALAMISACIGRDVA